MNILHLTSVRPFIIDAYFIKLNRTSSLKNQTTDTALVSGILNQKHQLLNQSLYQMLLMCQNNNVDMMSSTSVILISRYCNYFLLHRDGTRVPINGFPPLIFCRISRPQSRFPSILPFSIASFQTKFICIPNYCPSNS